MKKSLQLITLFGLAVVSFGCATPYMTDRGQDVVDVFTLSSGKGYGLKLRVGPLHLGAPAYSQHSKESGLRAGKILCPEQRDNYVNDFWFFFWGGHELHLTPDPRGKSDAISMFAEGPRHPNRKTQVEICLGAGRTFRFGFNIAELVDAIVGWTTIDILKDDTGERDSNE